MRRSRCRRPVCRSFIGGLPLVALDEGVQNWEAPVARFVCGLTRRDLCTRSRVGRDRPAEQGAMAGEIIGRREELLAFDGFLGAVPDGGQPSNPGR